MCYRTTRRSIFSINAARFASSVANSFAAEIERLQETARRRSRYGHRDSTMILAAYRHGLRASEVCGLRWDQIELNSGRLHVRRAMGGIDNVHPLSGREIRALRQLRRQRQRLLQQKSAASPEWRPLRSPSRVAISAGLPGLKSISLVETN